MTMISSVWKKLMPLCLFVLMAALGLTGTGFAQSSPDMVTVQSVEVGSSQIVLHTDTSNLSFDSYNLGAPPRLVIDVFGAIPEFSERNFPVTNGYSGVRVGLYADKTRFVFDAEGGELPDAKVVQNGSTLVVSWGAGATETTGAQPAVITSGKPASVESIDFDAEKGVSLFKVALSSDVKLIPARVDGDIIRFGAKNTIIPRSLRRVVDASVFPSAVLQIIPYSTIVNGERCVMFAASMKGPVDFSVTNEGSNLVFKTVDGPFAEAAPPSVSSVTIPVDPSVSVEQDPDVRSESTDKVGDVIASLSGQSDDQYDEMFDGAPEKVYVGEPVSLVFDDVDVRKVMQLIAEISNKNLILSDDVKGKISLRLHDVPWDQALDLVLDIKELGTIERGNVTRILPLKQIDDMKTERLKAKQKIKKLEETKTQIFEVNYKDIDTIEDVVDDMLSDQGEVAAIDGSKKIMVTDIPSKLIEVEQLLLELDEPVKQVMIEARIVEMRDTEGLDLGVNWGLTYTNDAGLQEINRSTTTTSVIGVDADGDDITQTDTTSYTRVDGVETTSTSTETSDGTVSISESDSSLVGIGTNIVNDLAVGLGGAFVLPSTVGTAGLGSVINFGRVGLDSTVISLKLSALEASGKAKVVSSPKVMALDGEEAKIEQGTSIPYQSVGDQGTTTEFQDATLSLEVTPEVNPDGTVIMEIKASNSTIGSTVSTGAGSAPSIDTKEAETKLMLKDGETTVIGGIYIESTLSSNSGTPYLKDIPYLGKLFESNSSSSDRSELLIFITPHIIKQ
jgi:type IV pilus assembly protein PilQ